MSRLVLDLRKRRTVYESDYLLIIILTYSVPTFQLTTCICLGNSNTVKGRQLLLSGHNEHKIWYKDKIPSISQFLLSKAESFIWIETLVLVYLPDTSKSI